VLELAGMELLKLPGAGKSLRSGSYARLFAKSSKLTEGRKSYDDDEAVVCVGSVCSFGGSGWWEKLKRGFAGPARVAASFAFVRVGRNERPSVEATEATLVPLATLISPIRLDIITPKPSSCV
jgi:hypothetical protein